MGSEHGVDDERLLALSDAPAGTFADPDHPLSRLFEPPWRAALAYADAMTVHDVDDHTFAAVAAHFDDDAIVELTEVIAWENASARFNRALRIGSQHLWRRPETPGAPA